jgi:hypothetical protein
LRHCYFYRDAAVSPKSRTPADRYPNARVDMSASMLKGLEHRRMNTQPRAAPRKLSRSTLDDGHIPTGPKKHAACKQTAE